MSSSRTKSIDVFVFMDEDGEFDAGNSAAEAATRFNDNVSDHQWSGKRMFRLKCTVPLPLPIDVVVEVTEDMLVP